VKDAIGDLPLKPTGVDLHVGRNPTELSKQRYSHIPVGGNRFNLPKELTPNCWLNKPTGLTDVFGRLWWDRPSVTIRTEFFKPEKGRYLHPTEDRPITLREAARIQGFPDSYKFTGSYTQIAKQIGNAVPTALAESIAEQVLSILESPVTEAAESKESARLPLILSELAA
jgi:DNA (cytosine-5)-methyltransferase 1